MANQPHTPQLEFFIRRLPGGAVSNFIAEKLMIGDEVEVNGPAGSSFLRSEHTGPILAVAGGSGIAPIKSIIENALTLGMRQKIYLYFGVREEKDIYLRDHFFELSKTFPNLKFQLVVDEPTVSHQFRSGRVGPAVLSDFSSFDGLWNAYLAGPPLMVESLIPQLIQRGISEDFIWSDPFYDSSMNSKAT